MSLRRYNKSVTLKMSVCYVGVLHQQLLLVYLFTATAELTGTVIGNTGVESIKGTAVPENGTATHIPTWRNIRAEGSI